MSSGEEPIPDTLKLPVSLSIPATAPAATTNAPEADPWDKAFERLWKENEKLMRKYQAVLDSTIPAVCASSTTSRRKALLDLAKRQFDKIEARSAGQTEYMDKVLKIVLVGQDFIASAASLEPHAALAWAGVSLVLPILLNPHKQRDSIGKGIKFISDILVRYRIYDRSPPGIEQSDEDLSERKVKLFTRILEFEARAVTQYARNPAHQYFRDVARRDDWEGLKDTLNDLDKNCQTLMLALDRERTTNAYEQQATYYEKFDTNLRLIRARSDNQERMKVLEWLSDAAFIVQHRGFVREYQAGTGQWLVDSQEFIVWSSSKYRSIYCSGDPGTGKTFMSCMVIQYLQSRLSIDGSDCVCYLYCDYKKQKDQNMEYFLASLVEQLARPIAELPLAITSLYGDHSRERSRPSAEDYISVLKDLLSRLKDCFIIIDALDECTFATKLIKCLFKLQDSAPFQLFATSRMIPEIREQFMSHAATTMERNLSSREIEHAMAVEDVESGMVDADLDLANVTPIKRLLSFCAGLVILEEETQRVIFVHYTTQEFFETLSGAWLQKAQTVLTRTCLSYLSFETFSKGPCDTYENLVARLDKYALFHYAARNWSTHASKAPEDSWMQPAFQFSQSTNRVSSAVQCIRTGNPPKHIWFDATTDVTGLHLVSYLGLTACAKKLLESGSAPDAFDFAQRTPLSWAAEGGHVDIAKMLLLRNDVSPDSRDENLLAPFDYAVLYENLDVMSIFLLREEVNPNTEPWYEGLLLYKDVYGEVFSTTLYYRPLQHALFEGKEGAVRLLLEQEKVDVKWGNESGRTALYYAARHGHAGNVRLLLARKDVIIDSKDRFGAAPIDYAAMEGHQSIVKLLEERGCEVSWEPQALRDKFAEQSSLASYELGESDTSSEWSDEMPAEPADDV